MSHHQNFILYSVICSRYDLLFYNGSDVRNRHLVNLQKDFKTPSRLDLIDKFFKSTSLQIMEGFDKIDTIQATRHVTTTFIRIIDDFIYLKLNEEFNINSIDISNKEQLNKNRETAGQSKSYFGKLLLNAFGSYSQTFIQSTKPLSAPLGKFDKLTFNFVDSNNNSILNYNSYV